MAKDKITEYDATANNNTVCGDVNIAENSALPSDMNNFAREIMSHLKEGLGSGTPLYVDQTNNRIGIGTSSPTTALTLGTSHTATVQNGGSNSAPAYAITSGALGVNGITAPAANSLGFVTASTERMRIDSSGNLIKVGGVIKGERGTASAPAYSFSDDTDTGMFNDANQHLGFSVGGSERMRIDSSGNLKFNSGYGSAATAYGCRAWVNFNGTGTVAIRASGNVSSITDSSTGNYQVNFTTAMPDANYVTNVTPLNTVSSDYGSVAAVATSSVSVVTFQNSGSAVDVVGVYVTVLR